MTEPPPTPRVTPSELDHDLSCTRCGYNLRGLRTDGVCPECATPIREALNKDLLRYADPEWVNKLRLGLALMLCSILLFVVLGGAPGLIGLIGFPARSGATFDLLPLFHIVAVVVDLWAVFRLTAPDPALANREDSITLRRVLRVCAVTQRTGNMLQALVSVGSAFAVLTVLMLPLAIVSHFGLFVFLGRFAQRIPDEKLARSTRIVMWGYAISFVVAMGSGLSAAYAGTTTSYPIGLVAVLICVFGVAALFGIWYVVLLFQYYGLFKKAAVESRTTLAAAVARSDNQPSGADPQN